MKFFVANCIFLVYGCLLHRGHNNFHDEMKVSVFMDDIWDFIAMINNSLHFRFSIIAMKKEIIFSVLPFMSMIILFKHDPQSLIAMNHII